jgi:hypothetical protein
LFTIFVAPVLLLVYWSVAVENDLAVKDAGTVYFYMVFLGSAFGLVALWLFRLLYKDLERHSITTLGKRSLFCLVGVVLIWVTFFFLNSSIKDWEKEFFQFPVAYSVALIMGVVIFKYRQFTPDLTDR